MISFFLALVPFAYSLEKFAETNGIEICYETFGDPKDPPILLMMGGCCQGMIWPEEFCKGLENQGFFVTRYDHRDTGKSSCIDYDKKPYSHRDMAQDAIGLLDHLQIEKVNVVGLFMGGPIAEVMATEYSERVLSLTLIATNIDFRPHVRSLDGLPFKEGELPPSTDNYVAAMREILTKKSDDFEAKIFQRMEIWQLLNGDVFSLDPQHN